MDRKQHFSIGLLLAAFIIWGFTPLYFKLVQHVAPIEILAHRAIWSCLFLLLILGYMKRLPEVWALCRQPKSIGVLLVSSILISVNWGLYVYSIVSGQVLSASLGYFITPLLNIFFGIVVLREEVSLNKAIALILAGAAVFLQIRHQGDLPLLALSIASTFALYTLVRKIAKIDALAGLTVETLLLSPLALVYLVYLGYQHQICFGCINRQTDLLLTLSWIVTAIPMILFVAGSQNVPLSLVGFLQFISPTGQFFLATYIFGEPIDNIKFISFAIIWIGLGVLFIPFKKRDQHT